ncbi:MAG: CrcB family protein [Alicyclobacillus sp.]|nr:CrcB family protein [Alicyclobacillus sp.]
MRVWLIGFAGFVGANLRFAISEWVGLQRGFPISTLLINLSGCAFLGWFYTATTDRWRIPADLRTAIGTGLVGAFTTFSTFAVEWWKLLASGLRPYAWLYFGASLGGGLACAYLGMKVAKRRGRSG